MLLLVQHPLPTPRSPITSQHLVMAAISLAAQVFCNSSYDYVIAGGGAAGLVLAARLTENPQVTVAVAEAGEDRSGDAVVLVPGLALGQLANPDYDWNFLTTPQVWPSADSRSSS